MRNLLFIGLCLLGMAGVAVSLFEEHRIPDPPGHTAGRWQQPEFRYIVHRVNVEFQDAWRRAKLDPTTPADDLTIARRLALGLTGTVPSLEEIRALEALPPGERISWWVARLVADRRYSDYVAERFARSHVGTQNGPFIVYRRRRYTSWLSDQLHENRPYDETVRDLISETGLWTDSPAVNFITVTLDENDSDGPDEKRLAGRVTRAFLGMRIDCLQCHDDRLGNIELGSENETRFGLQSDFHQLAAFFGEAEASLQGISDGNGDYSYQYLEATEEQVISPAVPFAPELLGTEGTLRQRLANWITHPDNKTFARATVNRVWALMFGRPLVEPIDNIPLFGPFPPAMETLADDFVEHDYDLRRLIELIAATDVFQMSSRATFEITPRHEDQWAVFPLTRLRPEQVAGALIQSCNLTTIDANAHILSQLTRFFQQGEFVQRYGDMGEDEFDDRGGTVTQRLVMMNGDLVKQRTDDNPLTNAATAIARLAPDRESSIETSYLSVLTRRPTPRELEELMRQIASSEGSQRDRDRDLEDLFWVLLNSSEFSWNH